MPKVKRNREDTGEVFRWKNDERLKKKHTECENKCIKHKTRGVSLECNQSLHRVTVSNLKTGTKTANAPSITGVMAGV